MEEKVEGKEVGREVCIGVFVGGGGGGGGGGGWRGREEEDISVLRLQVP